MFGTAVIVFREVLEAAIIIGIVSAATRDVPKRNYWLSAGLVLGLIGSALVAASTDAIAEFASGIGQELFNAMVLGLAVLMLAWHSIWMSTHGAELAAHARNVGASIREGRSASSILMMVVGLAVLREGSETVLFLYGIAASGSNTLANMLLGGFIGTLMGIIVGYTIYAGLLCVPLRWFFATTAALVLLLAAGMASTAARFLIQADLLPSMASPLWDTSQYISEEGLFGMILHSLIGYDARPEGMQVVFYVAVLLLIVTGMRWAKQSHENLNNGTKYNA